MLKAQMDGKDEVCSAIVYNIILMPTNLPQPFGVTITTVASLSCQGGHLQEHTACTLALSLET